MSICLLSGRSIGHDFATMRCSYRSVRRGVAGASMLRTKGSRAGLGTAGVETTFVVLARLALRPLGVFGAASAHRAHIIMSIDSSFFIINGLLSFITS